MNRQRKKPKNPGRRVAKIAHGGSPAMGDATSEALKKAGNEMGNQEIAQKIQDPNSQRDKYLQVIVDRLEGIRGAQLKEDAAHRDSRNLYRRPIYQGKDHQADPGRYRDVARHYLDAARAFAAGQLDHGARKLEQAFLMEEEAYASVPGHVSKDLEQDDRAPGPVPSSLDKIASGATCGRCPLPQGLVLADQIEGLDPHIELRGVKGKKPHHWWDEEQEEEEEEDEDDDGDKG